MKKKIFCSLPMARYKLTEIGPIYNHNERQKGCYENNKTLDISRKDLNYHLKNPEGYYLDVIRHKLKDSGIKERKNQNLMIELIPSASRDWMNSLKKEEQRAYLAYSYEFIADRFGEDNVLSAVVHMDEGFPHLHVCMVPITKDDRLNTTEFIGGGREALSNLLDEYYYHMVKVYPMIHRGIPFAKTQRKKIPLYLYRCVKDIAEDHREICAEIENINLVNLSHQKVQILKDMQLYIEEIAKIKNMVRSTDEYIHNIEAENEEKNQEIVRLQKENRELIIEKNALSEKNITLDTIVSQIDLPTLSKLKRNAGIVKEQCKEPYAENLTVEKKEMQQIFFS